MVAFLAGFTAVLVGGLLGLAFTAVRRFRDHDQILLRISESLERIAQGADEPLKDRLRDVEDLVDRLPKKWEDIKREAAAAETRARNHIRRAQKELDERGFTDPGVDQLGYELGVSNGDGGDPDGVRRVREEVASVAEQAGTQQVPGPVDWREATRVLKYG